MGKSSPKAPTNQTQTVTNTPYLKGDVGYAANEAQNLYKGGVTPYFPGQTYVDYSPETMQALQMTQNRATNGSPLTGAANAQTLATINGDYLQNNPYLDSVINNSLNDVTRKYTDQVLPGLASNFAQSGRYGSGIQQELTGNAIGQLGKEAMGVAGGLRYDNYNSERQRQLQASAMAPSLAQSDYFDAQQLLGVGGARESLSQAKLQDELDRYNYDSNAQSNLLDQYISRIGALNSGGGSQQSVASQAKAPGSGFANALGTGLSGLGLASQMGAFGTSGLLGGLFAGGSGGLAASAVGAPAINAGMAALVGLSDISLKENIKEAGTENGHKVYEFNYKDDKDKTRYIGVMAQDLGDHEAVIKLSDGTLAVNYDMIGVKFRKVGE